MKRQNTDDMKALKHIWMLLKEIEEVASCDGDVTVDVDFHRLEIVVTCEDDLLGLDAQESTEQFAKKRGIPVRFEDTHGVRLSWWCEPARERAKAKTRN
jgi:hypothetical protein